MRSRVKSGRPNSSAISFATLAAPPVLGRRPFLPVFLSVGSFSPASDMILLKKSSHTAKIKSSDSLRTDLVGFAI